MTEIDVSGCKFYCDTYCNDDNYLYGACAERDCYYKQLKRLEAENAKLKDENFKLGQFDIKKVTLVENRQLEEENAKLKEDVKEAQEAYNFKRIHCEVYKADNIKLRKALEEIKEVFKKYDSEEEGTVAELLHDVFEVYGRVCEVLKDE